MGCRISASENSDLLSVQNKSAVFDQGFSLTSNLRFQSLRYISLQLRETRGDMDVRFDVLSPFMELRPRSEIAGSQTPAFVGLYPDAFDVCSDSV